MNHSHFLLSGKSARSSLTCLLRTAHLWETLGRRPSWSLESKAAWPTSASSVMALALQPSVPPWLRFKTTWMKRSNKWTRCTWALVATPRDPQTVGANRPTKWTSTGNESSKENPYELENPQFPLSCRPVCPFWTFLKSIFSIDNSRAEFVCLCVLALLNLYHIFVILRISKNLSACNDTYGERLWIGPDGRPPCEDILYTIA